jgi:DNA-binding transcriptional MocR family regulator
MVTQQRSSVESFLRRHCAQARPGARLPSARSLQARFGVSPNTVRGVVRRLVMEGLVVTRPGDGTFVSSRGPGTARPADYAWQTVLLGRSPVIPSGLDHLTHPRSAGTVTLDNAFCDPGLQASDLLARAAARAVRRHEVWDRCPPQGLPVLRDLLAGELGAGFSGDDVLITPGAQAALDTTLRVLTRPGDPVLLEDPCYPGALVAASMSALVPVPVPTDRDGVIPDALADALARSGARLMVLQPRHSNPTGSVLAQDRRTAVLELAAEFGCVVVEDDWVRDLDHHATTGPPLVASDRDGHVISIRSLSKSSAPGLRIASLTARGPVLTRLVGARMGSDFFVAPLLQATAAELLSGPGWQRHLSVLRSALAERCTTLVDALAAAAPTITAHPPSGGVALWVELPTGLDERAVVDECAARGVRVSPGSAYRLTEAGTGHLRLAFGKDDPDTLVLAARRIGAAVDALSPRPSRRRR